MVQKIAIIGGGAWGTALAAVVRRAGHDAHFWARDPAVVTAVATRQENPKYLPGVALPPGIIGAESIADAVDGADAVLLATPAQSVRETAIKIAAATHSDMPVAICAKGVERRSLLLMSEVVQQVAPRLQAAVLSGPTFANEVARGLPTAVTLASTHGLAAESLSMAIGNEHFRPYRSNDVIGVEMGGAAKNVIAIACGFAIGLSLGENARAALMTRGLAEVTRLAIAKGGRRETLMGLSGFGDLTLTCTSLRSRNTSFGCELARGRSAEEVLGERQMVTEGAFTAEALIRLAEELGVEMPIARGVQAVLSGTISVRDMMQQLLSRPFRPELAQ